MDRAGESPREHLFYDRAFAEEQFKEGIRTGRIDARPGETRLQWTRRKALEDTEPWDVKEKRVAALIKSCLPKNYKPPNGKSQSYSSQPPVPGRAGESPREHLFYDRAFAEEQFREDVRTGRTDARPGETRLQWTRRKALEDTEPWDVKEKRVAALIQKSLPKNYKPPNGKSQSYSSQPPAPVPRQPSLEDIAEEQPDCLDTTFDSFVTAGDFSDFDDDDFQDAEEPSRPGSAAWGYDPETLERVLPKWARASQCSPQGPRLVGEDIDHQESTGVSYTKTQDSYPMEEEVGDYAQESYPMEEEVGDYAQFEDELEGLGEYQRHRDILSRTLPSNPMDRGAEFHQDQQQDTEVWDEARMKQAEDTIKSYIPKNYKPPNGNSQPPASMISGTPYDEDLRFAFRPPEEFDGRTIPGIPYSDEERDAGFTVYQVAHFYDEVRAGRIDALPGENYLQWSRRKNREDTEVWDEARMKQAEDTIKSYIPKNYKPPNGNSQPPASMISGTPYDEDLRYAFRPPEEFDGRTIPGIPYSDEERDAGFTVYQVAHFYDEVRAGRIDALPGENYLQWSRRKNREDTEVWDEARMKQAEDTIRSYIPKNYKPPNGNSQSCPSEPPPSRPKTMRSPPPGRAGAEPVGWSPAERSADGRSLAGPSPAGRSADGRSLTGPSPAGRSADGRSPAGRSADGRSPAGRSPAPASTSRGTASSNYQNPNRKFFGLDESRASPKPRSPVATSPRPGTSAARTKPPVGFGSSSSRTGPRGTGASNCSSVDQRTHSKLW